MKLVVSINKRLRYDGIALFFCIRALILALCLFPPSMSRAQGTESGEPRAPEEGTPARFDLGEVVVTATRQEDPVEKIPRNVTVITAEDIAQAPGNNVVDLLAREANVNLRSAFGHDKFGGVDIRGMGDTYVSNVVVMVDGYRLNPPDMAGPDFSSVPLDQIERIEIVRGAGSVVYGDGAVGGVINIITKRGEGPPEARVYGSYGSYDTLDGRASYSGRVDRFAFNIFGGYYDSDGYRDNGYFKRKDLNLGAGYDVTDTLTLSLKGIYHTDEYGLPGSVSRDEMDSEDDRRGTDFPDDWGETTDRRIVGTVDYDLGDWGGVTVHAGFRDRKNPYVIGFTPLLPEADQRSEIHEKTGTLDAGWVKEYPFFGRNGRFQAGADFFSTDYVREAPSQNERKNSDVRNAGLFFQNRWGLPHDLSLDFGYRYNRYKGRFRTDGRKYAGGGYVWQGGKPYRREWHHHAYDIGLVYAPRPDVSFFASFATSFRNPNVDEFALADDDLRPQEGRHLDVGGRFRLGRLAEMTLTFFYIRIEDEIYYGMDPDTGLGVNGNYDDLTERTGVETDVRVYATDTLLLWGNYAYTDARFDKRDTFVPLVPKHKASLGFEWQIFEPLVLAVTGTYVGSRFDGNDEFNDLYPKLPSYTVVDGKLTYTYKVLKVFCGVNKQGFQRALFHGGLQRDVLSDAGKERVRRRGNQLLEAFP